MPIHTDLLPKIFSGGMFSIFILQYDDIKC